MKKIEINDANRTNVAKAVNFNEYPVLTIDLADTDEYGLVGCKCRIDNGSFRSGDKYFVKATLRAWKDEKILSLSGHNVCLHASYTYSDVAEMIEWANAPIIKADQDIAVVVHDSGKKEAYSVYIVHTGSRIDANCIEPMKIERLDMSEYF